LALLTVTAGTVGKYEIEWYEIFLWIWIFGAVIEEISQYRELKANYFAAISNRMDFIMCCALVAYIALRIFATSYRSNKLVESYSYLLIVSTILCYIRLLNVFAVSKSLGPLCFVIVRLFRDVLRWSFIFSVFMISFQIGIFALTQQAGGNPWELYPKGTMGVSFTTIIGEQGDSTMEYMQNTGIGVILISIYALISQVMLVNLLIAMMGDTYSTVKENADKEWKFYRYGLVTEFISTSAYPPPFNLIFGPISFFYQWRNRTQTVTVQASSSVVAGQQSSPLVHMKIAKDKTIEKEKETERDSLAALSAFVRESTRLSTNQIDGERSFIDYNMTSIHNLMEESNRKQKQMKNEMENHQNEIESLQAYLKSVDSKLNIISPHLIIDS